MIEPTAAPASTPRRRSSGVMVFLPLVTTGPVFPVGVLPIERLTAYGPVTGDPVRGVQERSNITTRAAAAAICHQSGAGSSSSSVPRPTNPAAAASRYQ